jgi:DNA-binding NtrC family response regulator
MTSQMNTRLSILVNENEPDCRWLLQALLESHGYEVVSVSSVQEAVQQLGSSTFSLVLTDYGTGDQHSAEQEALMLLHAALPLPVGCVTAWARLPESVRGRLAFVLTKPCQLEEILGCVEQTVSVQGRP